MPKSLLVADDSLTIRKVIGMIFTTEDFEITSVDNGLEAISKARELRPDLVLADVTMPGRSGYEVCEAIKSDPETQSMPVLLLAGTFEPFDESRARAVKADDYIVKPFESQALLEKVRTLTGAPKPAEPPRQVFTTESSAPSARPAGPSRIPPAAGAFAPSSTSFPGGGPPRPSAPAYSLGQPVPRASVPPPSVQGRPAPLTPVGLPSVVRPPPSRIPTPAYAGVPPQRPVPSVARPVPAVASASGAGLPIPGYQQRPPPAAHPLRATSPTPAPVSSVRPGPAPLPVAGLGSRGQASLTPVGSYESLRSGEMPSARPIQMARDGGEGLLREALSKASREVIEKVVWEVVPQLAETIIREHLDQLVKNRGGQT